MPCFVKNMQLKILMFSQTQYFEMDETERANVWKQKSFEEMKKKERMFEKMKLGQGEIGNEVLTLLLLICASGTKIL
jgi:hypothetical protein